MSDRVHVATRKGLFTMGRAANGWVVNNPRFVGDQVLMVLNDPRDCYLYAALRHKHFGNKLHRSADGGGSWQEVAPPSYPPKPDDTAVIRDAVRGLEVPWHLQLIWELRPDPSIEGGLWCGTIPGGLFHSADRGDSWQLVRSLWDQPARAKWSGGGFSFPGIHSVLLDPVDPAHITVGVSCGGVWVSHDAGRTWACQAEGMRAAYLPPEQAHDPDVQDPHFVVQCRSRPDAMWAQHHNRIFRTTDGGARWHEITGVEPSSFGFAAAVHPDDPETAWFVPSMSDEKRVPVGGRVVVTRTSDGGRSFEVLNRGLPSTTPTTSSSGTRATWTRPARSWPWAAPQSRSGSARTAATGGRLSSRTCPQSTRCAS